MWPFKKKSKTDKRFYSYGLLELNNQLRLAKDFEEFLRIAYNRGFAVELVVVVDGQFSSSSIMLNKKDAMGEEALIYLHCRAVQEMNRLEAQLAEWEGRDTAPHYLVRKEQGGGKDPTL